MANRVHGATWAEHAGLTDEPYAAKEAGPEASQRTLYPMVTGGSVVAVKYAGGVLVAADTLGFYGSLARYDKIRRMEAVGVRKDTLVAAGGDLSDYQYIVKTVEARAIPPKFDVGKKRLGFAKMKMPAPAAPMVEAEVEDAYGFKPSGGHRAIDALHRQ